ncbi:uncharacterized protein LOC115874286 [Sitophilus oryzae]|uniref:Uncharacterized protein LOC115874286 n=1 Tax=Sitophilus oryzae TaxID=7048 RepID=A0A6J2X248_SITOR|nr:uncharacterized protein LOC115874286 [Sitophilus oryzae]
MAKNPKDMANSKTEKESVPQVGRTNVNSQTLKKVCLEDSGGGKNSLAPTTKMKRICQRPHSLYIATHNARTLLSDEKLLELEEELKNLKWDILGIREARRIGEGQVILKSGNTLCYSGEETAIRGFGILVHKKHNDMIVDVKNISPRVICLKIKLNKKYSVKVIQAYAPTTESTDDELENFYEDVSIALQNRKTHYTMLIGDFNANVGSKQDEAETSVSYHGSGSRNERGSDHRIVRAEIKINIKKERTNMILKKNHKEWVAPENKDSYKECIASNLNYENTNTIDEIYENIKGATQTAIEKFCPKKVKEQKLNQRTELLMKQRRDMEDKSTQEYRTLNREIPKEIRKHRRQQNTEKIRNVIEKNQSLKVLRNSTMGRKEIQKIKDMHGNIGIRTDIRKVINQGSEEIPEITEEEIISALRDMKNNRAAGDDGLVIESIQEGGPEIIKALNVLFNKCIEEEITPSQWNNATIIIVHKKGNDSTKPLRIELNSYLKKALILRSAYKLKGKNIFINHDLSKKERVVNKVLKQNLKEAKEKGLRAYIKRDTLVIGSETYNYEQLVERGNKGNESDCEVFTDIPSRPSLSAPGTPVNEQPVQPIERHKQETHYPDPKAKPTSTIEFTINPGHRLRKLAGVRLAL